TEFAQTSEWADGRSLDWYLLDHAAHRRVQELVRELNSFAARHPAMWALDDRPEGFRWLDADDAAGNTVSFVRSGGTVRVGGAGGTAGASGADEVEDVVVVVVNFGGSD